MYFGCKKNILTAGFNLAKDTEISQLLEIDGCSLALGDVTVDWAADAAVRLPEKHFDELSIEV